MSWAKIALAVASQQNKDDLTQHHMCDSFTKHEHVTPRFTNLSKILSNIISIRMPFRDFEVRKLSPVETLMTANTHNIFKIIFLMSQFFYGNQILKV